MIYICSHGHKNIVHCVKWNQNGNWVLTASKDQIIKVCGLCFCTLVCFSCCLQRIVGWQCTLYNQNSSDVYGDGSIHPCDQMINNFVF